MVALFVILTIIAFLLVDGVVLWTRRRKAAPVAASGQPEPGLAEVLPEPDLPGGVFLSPAHLWVGLMPAGHARIGFDPLIRAAMGEPDWVDVPAAGTLVRKGEPLFSARWANRSVLFHSPVEGTVQSARPSAGNDNGDGWVITLQPDHASDDLQKLPMAEQARRWFSEEWARLRDFVQARSLEAAPVPILPDGGAIRSGWLKLEPDGTWDRFVHSFLLDTGPGAP